MGVLTFRSYGRKLSRNALRMRNQVWSTRVLDRMACKGVLIRCVDRVC